jgi:hypothetical protein
VLEFTVVVTDASLREWFFEANITVQTGPNTFIHTWQGIVTVVGILVFTAAMIIFPIRNNRKKEKENGSGFSERLSEWQKKREEKRKIREKKREKKKQEREAIRQERERERIARINANEKEILEKFESILEMTERVKISQVAKSLAISTSQLFEKLIQWQDILPFQIDGEYIEVDDTEDFTLSVREKIAEISKHYSCYECGFPIERTGDICPDCKQMVLKCSVCKLPISFGDEIGGCPYCETKGHLTHLQEWVKTQGKCPVCLKELKVDELMQEKREKKK